MEASNHVWLLLLLVSHHALSDVNVHRYQLTDGQRSNVMIADLVVDHGLSLKYSSEDLNLLRFRILNPQNNVNISVITNTGKLYTNGTVDRDILCPMKPTCSIHLDVMVQPSNYFEIIKVAVDIEDINDNPPVFPQEHMTVSVLESVAPGSTWPLLAAVDNDSPIFGIQSFYIRENIEKFSIQHSRNIDGSMNVRLFLRKRLDREHKDRYVLTVDAEDGGPTPHRGSMTVEVHVIDANDNSPIFVENSYAVSIHEHRPIDSVIIRVKAQDKDKGQNAEILYGFSEYTARNYGNIFGINRHNGDVYIKGTLDREQSPVYTLIVTARDSGPDAVTSDTTLVVNLIDINDNQPEIKINTMSESVTNRALVSEDSLNGSFVAHIAVEDQDTGRNGRFNCSLNDNRNFALVPSDERDYQLKTARLLDRETQSSFNLAITCIDNGEVPLVSVEHLQVIVTDINDNYPEFNQSTYTGVLVENNDAGAIVLTVNATDRDIGNNGDIVYSIDFNSVSESFFEIHQNGRVIARRTIDREVHDRFEFPVIATDRGEGRRTGSARVIVTIQDQNDEVPTFPNDTYWFNVDEEEAPAVYVGSVNATDNDTAPYNAIFYSFSPGVGTSASFRIDSQSGVITTAESLDRDVRPSYYMVVIATDENDRSKSSTARVVVTVNDINDNDPRFIFPSFSNHTVNISNKVPTGHMIARIRAQDDDASSNSRLLFLIGEGNNGNTFALDRATGNLTVISSLAGIKYRKYDLSLTVKDHGSPPRSSEATLTVIVNQSIPFVLGNVQHSSAFSEEILLILFILGGAILAVLSVICLTVCLVRRHGRRHSHKDKKYRMQALPSQEENTPTPTKMTTLPVNGTSPSNLMSKHSPRKEFGRASGSIHQSVGFGPVSAYDREESPTRRYVPNPVYSVPDKSRCHLGREIEVAHTRGEQKLSGFNDPDQCSQHSADGSNTDSGRGASEEGDAAIYGRGIRGYMHYHQATIVQPIISGVRPLPPCPPPPPARAITSSYGYATHRGPRMQTFNPLSSGCAVSGATIKEMDDSPARSVSSTGTAKVTWGDISTSSPPRHNDQLGVGSEAQGYTAASGVPSSSATLPTKSSMKKLESMIV